MKNKFPFVVLSFLLAVSSNSIATVSDPDFDRMIKSYRSTLEKLVAADTTNPPGNEARAVKILAARLKSAGIQTQMMEFAKGRENLVARLKGTGAKKPLLLLAHLDVVGTEHQAWTTSPHQVIEKDGYLQGRGVRDDLGMAVANLEIFIALKKAKTVLSRDVILAFTGDEESGGSGLKKLLEIHPEWVDAEIALNEGGSPIHDLKDTPPLYIKLQVAEKVYQDFMLTATGKTGHSSTPTPDNAIYKLANALQRLGAAPPQYRLLPVTQAYYKMRATIETGELAKAMAELGRAKSIADVPAATLSLITKDPTDASTLSTTCVATLLSGGTKANALPAEASALVNCRVLPDEKIKAVQERLQKLAGDQVEVKSVGPVDAGPPSPNEGEIPTAIAKLAAELWSGIPVIPTMGTGASDSKFLRARGVAAYGFSPFVGTIDDGRRTHGIDERVEVSALGPGLRFMHRLVLVLAQ